MKQITTLLVAACMTLAAFAQTPSTVGVALQPRTSRVVGTGTNLFTANADRAVATIDTVARLATLTNAVHGAVVDARGYATEFDCQVALRYTLNTNSAASTNRFVIANGGGSGKWVHEWAGDAGAFGVKPDDILSSTNNGIALNEAASYARTYGQRIQLPAGTIYSDRAIENPGMGVVGKGSLNDASETTLRIITPNTSAITNLALGAVVADMHIRGNYYSWNKTATTGYGIHGVSGTAMQQIRNCYIQGFYGGIKLASFDTTIADVDIYAKRPIHITGSGTQNLIERVAVRGNPPVTGLTDDTSITCSSYTAGSTNFVVSDASNLSVGDYIRPRSSTEFANTISYGFTPRKITAISGTTITINHPWDLSFSDAFWEFALGKGFSAIETITESVLTAVNAEWGSWDHIYTPNSGPTASSAINGMHVEGWVVDPGSGVNSYVINGVNTSITGSYIDMANVTVFDTAGFALAEGGTRGTLQNLHVRDFRQYQAVPYFYAGAYSLTKTYSGRLAIEDINNAGADILQRTVDGTQWRNTVADFKFGESGELVRVDGQGVGRAVWFGFTDIPTGGNFVQNDEVITSNERYRVLSTGSFQTAAGSNRMFNGSSVLLVDQTARGVLGRRTPVAFAVTNGLTVSTNHLVVREQLRNSPDTNALVASASSGARMIQVADASGVQQGDPGVIVEGSTFNDVVVSRVQSPYVWFTRPLTNAFTTSATFFTGIQMFSASTNDVEWQALKFVAPNFVKEVDYLNQYRVGGDSVGTALTVVGGFGGVPSMAIERPGAGTNSFLVGSGQFRIRNEADDRSVFSTTPSGSDLFWTVGDPSGNAAPFAGTIQGEKATGTNLTGGNLTVRTGTGTGTGVPPQLNLAAALPGSSGSSAQTYGTALRIQFPITPDATVYNSPIQLPRFDGTNWVLMYMSWTNEAGIWRQIWQ